MAGRITRGAAGTWAFGTAAARARADTLFEAAYGTDAGAKEMPAGSVK